MNRFPSHLFGRLFWTHLLLGASGILATLALIVGFSETTLRLGNRTFIAGVSLTFALIVLTAFFSWLGARPLKSLLTRARYGRVDPLTDDTPDEWSELEHSIAKIERDLSDRTERLGRERDELTVLMASIAEAIVAVDSSERLLFFNSQFGLLTGLRDDRKHLWEILRQPEILEAFRSVLTTGTAVHLRALALERVEGDGRTSPRYFSLSVNPLRRAADATPYGAVGIFHDVTELKRAEQIRIDFVANVSHELRTPLTAIKGFSDTLLSDLKSQRPILPEVVEPIQRNAERLMALIQDLLDLSSLESTTKSARIVFDPLALTQKVVERLTHAAQSKKHEIRVDGTLKSLRADPGQIEQVLTNLIDNAIKYTPDGGRIDIRWGFHHSSARLEVSDNGPGIPGEHLPRLFERFFRVESSRSREQGGTGLGLAIVKHIVLKHEGRVWAESKLAQGTRFICEFPELPTKKESEHGSPTDLGQ